MAYEHILHVPSTGMSLLNREYLTRCLITRNLLLLGAIGNTTFHYTYLLDIISLI